MTNRDLNLLGGRFECWPETVTPPFAQIKRIGCCDYDEDSFKWYRQHTWVELRDFVLQNENMLDLPIDIYEFHSLEPQVNRYFLKGALSALAQRVRLAKAFEDLPYGLW